MISSQNILSPSNWQDFELLCLKLWGEIWSKQDEIEFNSDNSNGQDGVDIYCVPRGQSDYFGIQCKNKKLFKKNGQLNKISRTTIDEEINKAKKFKPKLKKLIIATSLEKDKFIEEYVREINLSHIKQGLFSVQICFWDFISRKIFEHENVYNWYLNNENFSKNKSVLITFDDNSQELVHCPNFIKNHVTYQFQTKEEKKEEFEHFKEAFNKIANENQETFVDRLLSIFKKPSIRLDKKMKIYVDGVDTESQEYIESTYPRPKMDYTIGKENNLSRIFGGHLFPDKQELSFRIKIRNNGNFVIENFKLKFSVEGEFQEIKVKIPRISELKNYVATTWINDSFGLIEPDIDFIVQKDSFLSKEIILTPTLDKSQPILINWQLLSRDFNETGQLRIQIIPQYQETKSTMYVIKEEDCREEFEYLYNHYRGTYELNI